MPIPAPTPEELVQVLKRSVLPTLIVEGKDDVAIYRWIQELVGEFEIDFFPCTGRNNLLAVYKRRSEFPHLKSLFIADKDMWVFKSVPVEYNEIHFTSGYSIENDLFAGSIDIVNQILEKENQEKFEGIIQKIIKWFAFEVEQYLSDLDYKLDYHIDRILSDKTDDLCTFFLKNRNYTEPSFDLVEELNSEYPLKLRGKLIFALLEKLLHDKKYKKNQLFEIIIKLAGPNEFINLIADKIRETFSLENNQILKA